MLFRSPPCLLTTSFSATSTLFLNTSRGGDSTTSLGSLCHCPNTLSENKIFPNLTLCNTWSLARGIWSGLLSPICSGNGKSGLEAVIEHLVGRQGQPRGVQVHAVLFSDQKGWNKDPTLPKPHLRVSSGGKSISLEFLYNLGLRKVYSFFRLFLSVLLLHLC